MSEDTEKKLRKLIKYCQLTRSHGEEEQDSNINYCCQIKAFQSDMQNLVQIPTNDNNDDNYDDEVGEEEEETD